MNIATDDLQEHYNLQDDESFTNNPGCSQKHEDIISIDQSEFITMNVSSLVSLHKHDEIW